MNCEEVQELLGAYALDAVEAGERREVEDHLRECPRCRAEAAELQAVASMLAYQPDDAPPDVWDRIIADLERAPPNVRLEVVPSAHSRARSAARRVAALVTAAAVVALFVGAYISQARQIDRLQAAVRNPLQQSFKAAASAPGTRTFSLRSEDGELVVRGAITAAGDGFIDAGGLPALPIDRTYQFWGAIGDRRVSLGLLGADPGIMPFNPRLFTAFAITEEDAGGVVQSSAPAVVAGSLV